MPSTLYRSHFPHNLLLCICTGTYFAYLQFMGVVVNMQKIWKIRMLLPSSSFCLLKRQGYVCKYFRSLLTVAIWKFVWQCSEKYLLLYAHESCPEKRWQVSQNLDGQGSSLRVARGYIRRRCDSPVASEHFWKVSSSHHWLLLSLGLWNKNFTNRKSFPSKVQKFVS